MSRASAVATHPLLDRLIHGRAWIGIVTFALIGIVTMQLGLLKLNAGIGRALEHEAALQREDSALSVENSEVAAGDTVELQAARMGMQLVSAGALRFLSAGGERSDLTRAAAAASAPASTGTTTSEASASTATEAAAEPSATSTASGEPSSESTGAAAATSESTTSTESPTPASTSTAPAETTEGGASASSQPPQTAPTPAPTGESGGAPAGPRE